MHFTNVWRTPLTEILFLSQTKHLSEGKSGLLVDAEQPTERLSLEVLGSTTEVLSIDLFLLAKYVFVNFW